MLESIPYLQNPAELFAKIAHEPWAIFLDSGFPKYSEGYFDIIAFRPQVTLTTLNGKTTIVNSFGKKTLSTENPLSILKSYLKFNPKQHAFLPFSGGALGYFSYDLGRYFEKLPNQSKNDFPIPEMQIGIYDKVIIVDHLKQKAWFLNDEEQNLQTLMESFHPPLEESFRLTSDFHSNMSKQGYKTAFDKVKNYLFEGDCYQVNLSQRFQAQFEGSLWHAFCKLRTLNPAPYGAFLNLPNTCILSFSPEQFLKTEGLLALSRPIKGTIARSSDSQQDQINKEQLKSSLKDRTENVMIVDLIRNDFGRVCKAGTIKVPKLCSLESFKNVHHLVSTVRGELKDHCSSIDLMQACFPGGSITGAPKIRSQEIIDELEPNRRAIYCGSIGYIDHSGDMDLNIAIRTLYTYKNNILCSAGGAIVNDSKHNNEYQECFDKVNILLKGLN